jgi:hypothetical protein
MEDRDEFQNRTQGWVGCIRLNRKGDETPDVVEPGGRVFLTAEEQTLTAQAHRRREDSPFEPRTITHFDPFTHEPTGTFVAPQLELVAPKPTPARRAKAPVGA